MKRPSFKKRTWVVGLVVAVVAAMASIGAYAYWTTGGTGSGSATTGTVVDVVVNQTSVSAGTLYPGGPVEALSGDFDNPNAGPVWIASVTAVVSSVTPAPGNTLAGNGKPDCVASDFAIGGSAPVGAEVASGNGEGSWSGLTIRLRNRDGVDLSPAANQDNCKNATANITYTANAS